MRAAYCKVASCGVVTDGGKGGDTPFFGRESTSQMSAMLDILVLFRFLLDIANLLGNSLESILVAGILRLQIYRSSSVTGLPSML